MQGDLHASSGQAEEEIGLRLGGECHKPVMTRLTIQFRRASSQKLLLVLATTPHQDSKTSTSHLAMSFFQRLGGSGSDSDSDTEDEVSINDSESESEDEQPARSGQKTASAFLRSGDDDESDDEDEDEEEDSDEDEEELSDAGSQGGRAVSSHRWAWGSRPRLTSLGIGQSVLAWCSIVGRGQ